MIPRATYRLQFSKDFGFDAAARLAPYLARLGVSHVYAAPFFKARGGSTHGYDIVDHNAFNPELGGADGFTRMAAALRKQDIGLIVDFVPNHMAVGGADNPRWQGVLEWGAASSQASWFDIDWEPDRPDLYGKVLVPVLGDQYGRVLEQGGLRLAFDYDTGGFAVWANDAHQLPVCPLHYGRILGDRHPVLERLGDLFANLAAWRPHMEERAGLLKAELVAAVRESCATRAALCEALARFNGDAGDFESWRRLHALIQDQHWRAAHFRVAADDINYRRFFNINDLAGLRMELPEVFENAHRLVFELLESRTIDGLRIDHVDGLLDTKGYLERLRARAPQRDFYLVVEKILAPHESVRADWPVDGTTGYEFANLMLGLLVDAGGREAADRAYVAFTGDDKTFAGVVRESKLRIMENELASELNVLAREAARIAQQNPRTADFTRNILHRALKEIIACFPVYRTYVDAVSPASEVDHRDIDWAVTQAGHNDPSLDPSVFDFLRALLSGALVAEPRSGFSRECALRLAMKVQQYSGPVMAKALEDTAFYRYPRFVALNEVGGNPDQFGCPVSAFHKANRLRAERWPRSMLGTATHDTKRGEDARARLAVLSENMEDWARQVQIWSRVLRARQGDVEGTAPPHRRDEYLFYQTLIATWPVELLTDLDKERLAAYSERVLGCMIKSVREAKLHSTWARPDTAYEDAVRAFVTGAFDTASGSFFDVFLPFAARIADLGVVNSLVQTVLKLTVPGMPDIYQGAELWDLTMVDPDNRRPVDYAVRERLIAAVEQEFAADPAGAMRQALAAWPDGRIKLAVIANLLAWRREHPAVFDHGVYEPVDADGPDADRICCFLRRNGEDCLLVIAARFPARGDFREVEAALVLPETLSGATMRDVLTGARHTLEHRQDARDLLAILPMAVLVK